MLESLLNLLLRYRQATMAVGLLLFAVGFWNVWDLSVNDAPEHWMPRSTIRNWERFAEHFEYGDTVVIGVEFRKGVHPQDIRFLKNLRRDLSKIPSILRVTDLSIPATWVERVPITEMLKAPRANDDPYEIYRGVLYDDPRVWNEQSSGDPENDNRTLLTLVEIDAASDKSKDPIAAQAELDERRRTAMRQIYSILKKHEREDVTFHPAGAVVIQYELELIARGIVKLLVPVSLLLMLVSLGFGFRSLHAIIIAVFGGAWAIVVLMGGVVLGGWTLNVVTVGGPVLMVVITVSTTVHFAHYHSANNLPRGAKGYALTSYRRRFVRWIGVPCFGAALTTGFGFLMLSFNELRPLRELGIELFAGSILAFFGSYLVWLALPSLRIAPGKRLTTRRMYAIGQALTRRPAAVLALALPVLGFTIYISTLVKVAVDPFSFFEKESRVAQALDHFSSRKFGHYTLDAILVPRSLPDDPASRFAVLNENRKIAEGIQRRIAKRPEVRRAISEVSIQRRVDKLVQDRAREAIQANQPKRDLWSWIDSEVVTRPPAKSIRSKLAWLKPLLQYQLMQQPSWFSLATVDLKWFDPTWYDYGIRIMVLRNTFKWLVDQSDRGAIRMTFLVFDPGTGFRPLMKAVRKEVNEVPDDRFDYFFTGTAASVAVLSEQLVGAMLRGLLAAMLTMAVVCGFLFRSIRLTLIAFFPNAFPILTVFGVMGLFGIPLNSGSAMVASVALGVGLNDTVHFAMHYRVHRLEGSDCRTAVCETFGDTSRPMIMTSVVNCAGFAIFLLSDFQPMFHFGLLASIAMAAALVGDLVLLPNLLRVFDNRPWPVKGEKSSEGPKGLVENQAC